MLISFTSESLKSSHLRERARDSDSRPGDSDDPDDSRLGRLG